jgi:quercetin dioxygenase-like cupin family protein
MYYPDPKQREARELAPGVFAQPFWGENLMVVLVKFEPFAVVPHHSHPHEQAGLVLEGQVEFNIGGKIKKLATGDLYLIPGDVEHSAAAVGGSARVLDIFHPVREAYKFD